MKETLIKLIDQFGQPSHYNQERMEKMNIVSGDGADDMNIWVYGNIWRYPDVINKYQFFRLYKRNSILGLAVDKIADDIAGIKFGIEINGNMVDKDHPIYRMFNVRPHPEMSAYHFFRCMMIDLLVSGEAFPRVLRKGEDRVIANNTPTNKMIGMELLRSNYMNVIDDGYRITNYDYQGVSGGSDKQDLMNSVKHIKFDNPTELVHGLSPIQSIYREVLLHDMVIEHNLALLENGGRPSILVEAEAPIGADGKPMYKKESEMRAVEKIVSDKIKGVNNAGSIPITDKKLKIHDLQKSAKDMDYNTSREISAKLIGARYFIPEEFIGHGNKAYSNTYEAKLSLAEEGVIPKAKLALSDLNEMIDKEFKEDIELKYDFKSIPVLIEKRLKMMNDGTVATGGKAVITVNELREIGEFETFGKEYDVLDVKPTESKEETKESTKGTQNETDNDK